MWLEEILIVVSLVILGIFLIRYLDGDFEAVSREEYGTVKSWGINYVVYKETMASGRIRFKRHKL